MKYYLDSKNNLLLSRLGFGAWQLGNSLWSNMTFDEGVLFVKEALQQGITVFDTAPGYGNGESEKILGEGLKGNREKVFISSKFGHKADGSSDFRTSSMKEAIEESLTRLKTNYLDALLLHNPGSEILSHQTDHFEVMESLKKEGLIHHYGVSIDTYDELKQVLEIEGITIIEILLNVLFQGTLPLIEKAYEKGIIILAKVPLDSGWLSGKYNEHSKFEGIRSRWSQETITRRASLVTMIKELIYPEDILKVSMAFLYHIPGVIVIPGTTKLEQLKTNVENELYQITDARFNQLRGFYLDWIEKEGLPW
ncbi:MAG: aldo/keto reductase [Candidatus Izemoplasmatales bacterium]